MERELLLTAPVQNDVELLLGNLSQGVIQPDTQHLGQCRHLRFIPSARRVGERDNAAVHHAATKVDDRLGIYLLAIAESAAHGAGTERAVEREHPWRQLFITDTAVDTGIVLGIEMLLVVPGDDVDQPTAVLERRFDGLRDTRSLGRFDHHAIDHDLDSMLLLFDQLDFLVQGSHHAVHANPAEPLLPDFVERLLVFTLSASHDRSHDLNLRPLGQSHNHVDDLFGRLLGNRLSALRAMRMADTCVQQTQIVVDLGDRPNC